MSKDFMLTTTDNPFDPFEQFTSWFLYDIEKGYNTCGYLANIVKLSSDMSQKEIEDEIDRAIEEIVRENPLNIYTKAYPKNPNTGNMTA